LGFSGKTGMKRALTAKKEILDMGLDDITGLYEIIWRLNTLWPEIDIGEKYRLADEALRDLLKRDGVTLIKQWDKKGQRHCETIAAEKIDEILRNPVSWYPSISDDPTPHDDPPLCPSCPLPRAPYSLFESPSGSSRRHGISSDLRCKKWVIATGLGLRAQQGPER